MQCETVENMKMKYCEKSDTNTIDDRCKTHVYEVYFSYSTRGDAEFAQEASPASIFLAVVREEMLGVRRGVGVDEREHHAHPLGAVAAAAVQRPPVVPGGGITERRRLQAG